MAYTEDGDYIPDAGDPLYANDYFSSGGYGDYGSGWDYGPGFDYGISPEGYTDAQLNELLNSLNMSPGGPDGDIGTDDISGGGGDGGWMSSIAGLLGTSPGVLAGLLGAGAGMLGGQRQSGTQTITTEPWADQQPYLRDLFQRGQGAMLESGGGINGLELDALSNMYDAAQGPMSNPMLGVDNPFLDQAIDNSNQDIMRGIMPLAAQADRQSGSFGNTGIAETYGRTAADAMAKNSNAMRMADYGQQQNLYESDVGRRFGATQNLYGAGQAQRYDAFNPLERYGKLVSGSYGQSQNTPMYSNPLSNALGGGLLGSQIYSMYNQGGT